MSSNYDVSVRLSTIGQNEVSANLKNIQGVMSSMAGGLNDADIGGKRLSATFKQVDADGNKMSVTMRQLADSNQMVRNTFVQGGVSMGDFLGKLAMLGVTIGGVVAGLKAFVVGGVEMNDMLETSQIRLGIVLESLYKYPQAANQHAAATADAAAQIAVLKDRSLEVLAPLSDLLALNQKLAPAMAAAGVASAQQATDFSVLVAKIGDVTGQSYDAIAMQISRLVTTGQLARGEFAQTLRAMGVTPDVINSWKSMGTTIDGQSVLVANLTEKFKAYSEGHAALLQTDEGAWKQLTKAIKGDFMAALEGTAESLKETILGWRDYILGHKDEIVDALRTTFTVAGGVITAFGKTALDTIKDVGSALSGIGDEKGWVNSIIDGVTVVLKALNDLKMGFLVALEVVKHPIDTIGALAIEGITELQQALGGGTYGIEGVSAMMPGAEETEAMLEAVAAQNKFVQGVAAITDKVNAQNAALDTNAAKLKATIAAQGTLLTGGVHTGFEGENGPGVRVPSNVQPMTTKAFSAITDATKALLEFQATLASVGSSGPASDAVEKIEKQFTALETKITDVTGKLTAEHFAAPLVDAVRAALEGMAQAWEHAKLEEAFTKYHDALVIGLADLDTKWQAAGSAEAAYAEQVRGLAELDKTQHTLEDQASAVADITEKLSGGLIPAWMVFSTLMGEITPKIEAARARLLEITNLDAKTALDKQAGQWDAYLQDVYQKNILAKQGVVEAWQNALDTTANAMVANAATVEQGLNAGLMKFRASLGTVGQDVEKAVENIGSSLQSTLSTGFFDVITGKISDLGATFKKFGEDILKSISDVFSKILMRWLLVQAGVAENPLMAGVSGGGGGFGLGGSMPTSQSPEAGELGFGYGQGSSAVPSMVSGGGGWAGAGAAGVGMLGLGMGMNTLGHAQTTGQYIGGAMEVAGGIGAAVFAAAFATWLTTAGAAATVPVYGWIAAVILIIIGAIVSAFSKPPDIKLPVHVGEELAANMSSALGSAILQSYGKTLGGLAQITTAGGGDVTKVLNTLRVGEIPDEYLKSLQMTVYGKNEDDLKKGMKNFLETALPQTLMSFAFGRQQTGTTDKGANEDQLYGVPKFGNIDFTKPTAIVQMLQGIGFVNDKINEIAQQIDVKAPDDFVKWLTAYVGAVKGLQDASKKIGRSYEEIIADLDKTSKQTPAEAFAPAIADLTNQIATVGALVSDDQIAQAQTLVSNVQQLIQQEEQAVAQLHAMATQIEDQAKSLHEAVTHALQTPQEQAAALATDMSTQYQKLKDATNPTDVQTAWNAFLSDMTSTVNALVARVQALTALQQNVEAFLAQVGKPIIDPNTNPYAYLVQNAGQITAATKAFQEATGDQQVTNAQQVFALEQQRYAFLVDVLQKVADVTASINQSIEDQIFGIKQSGRSPQEQAQALWGLITQAQQQIAGATSPGQVQTLVSEIQGWIRQLQGLPVLPGHERDASQLFIDTLTATQNAANAALAAMGATFQSELDKIPAQLRGLVAGLGAALTTAQTTLTTDLGLLDDATVTATSKLGDFGNALTAKIIPLQTALQAIIDALTGAAAGIGKSTPDVPQPTTDPGEGNYWSWDPTTGKWVPKKNPSHKDQSPTTGNATAYAPGTNGGSSSSSSSISISVNVKTGAPEDIAAAVGANIVGPLVAWVRGLTQQAQIDLLNYIRAHPEIYAPTTGV